MYLIPIIAASWFAVSAVVGVAIGKVLKAFGKEPAPKDDTYLAGPPFAGGSGGAS